MARAILILLTTGFLLALALVLSGCASGTLKGSGEIAPTPAGHAVWCAKQPKAAGCPTP